MGNTVPLVKVWEAPRLDVYAKAKTVLMQTTSWFPINACTRTLYCPRARNSGICSSGTWTKRLVNTKSLCKSFGRGLKN